MGLGGYLAYVFLFGMIPYMGWCVGRAARITLLPPKTTKKVKVKKVKGKSVKKTTPTPKKPVTTTCSINDGLATLGVSLEILKSYIANGTIRTYKAGDSLILNAEDVIKVSKKPGKRVFPVLDGYRDEHKITHPVVFDA